MMCFILSCTSTPMSSSPNQSQVNSKVCMLATSAWFNVIHNYSGFAFAAWNGPDQVNIQLQDYVMFYAMPTVTTFILYAMCCVCRNNSVPCFGDGK